MLAANLAVFIAACAFFWQYLATGYWLDASARAYVVGMNVPLSGMFVHPLSIFAHPWMILVNSLLLALMFFVPVAIAVMYHEIAALGFVLVVAAVGRAPALALFQAVGCVLAARTHLRSDGPFLAALLGMSPLLAYTVIFAFTVGESAPLPLKQWVLYSVVAGAMLLAALAVAGVLELATLLRYRPGALCPVMLVMLAVAGIAFHVRVGADELEYVLLKDEIDRPAEPDRLFKRISLEQWRKSHDAEHLGREELRERLERDVRSRGSKLIDRCDRFLASHGDSARASGVLWLKAQLQSLSLDAADYEAAYDGSQREGDQEARGRRTVLIPCSAEFVAPAARATWQRLLDDHPDSLHGALAAWRLGTLALRSQNVGLADELLKKAKKQLEDLRDERPAPSQQGTNQRLFAPVESMPYERRDHYETALRDVDLLLWLMMENHVRDDPRSAEALAAYLSISRRDANRLKKLESLLDNYEKTDMGDNLKLAVALMATDSFEKARSLITLAQDNVSDAGIEANYELGRLRMRTGSTSALPLLPDLKKPREYFNVVAGARDNPWQRAARERLKQLAPATTRTSETVER